jgi:hypothetical protein
MNRKKQWGITGYLPRRKMPRGCQNADEIFNPVTGFTFLAQSMS